jgi:hypothetical protein
MSSMRAMTSFVCTIYCVVSRALWSDCPLAQFGKLAKKTRPPEASVGCNVSGTEGWSVSRPGLAGVIGRRSERIQCKLSTETSTRPTSVKVKKKLRHRERRDPMTRSTVNKTPSPPACSHPSCDERDLTSRAAEITGSRAPYQREAHQTWNALKSWRRRKCACLMERMSQVLPKPAPWLTQMP